MSSLKELRAIGAVMPDKPVRKPIEFSITNDEGVTTDHAWDIHVKKMSIGEYEELFLSGKDERSRTARVISAAITLGNDGKEVIDFQTAYKLHPNIATAMVAAFNEVNTSKKHSRPATGSSAT